MKFINTSTGILAILLIAVAVLAVTACSDDRADTTKYTCSNGTATVGSTSNSQNIESCTKCDSSYTLENNRCRPTKYTCAKGIAVDGSPDGNADVEKCADCDTNFSLSNERCIISTLTNVANVHDSDNTNYELMGAAEVITTVVGTTTYLFVTGFNDNGISVFSVAENGSLTNVSNVPDAGSLALQGALAVTTTVVGTTTYLFATGFYDDGVSVFSVAKNGTLTNVSNVTDAGDLEIKRATAVAAAVVGSTTYLFVTGGTDDGISVFSVGSDGTLTNVHNEPDTDNFALAGTSEVTAAVVGNTTYLFVTGLLDNGISVFSVGSDGTLTNVYNQFDTDTLEIEEASSLTTAIINDTTYLFVTGTIDSGISVFSVGSDGTLTNVHNEPDAQSQNRPVSVTTAIVGTTTYLFVAEGDDNGVSVFSVNSDGTLNHIHNQPNTDKIQLGRARSVTTAVVGTTTYLFVAANQDNGVSVFSIP